MDPISAAVTTWVAEKVADKILKNVTDRYGNRLSDVRKSLHEAVASAQEAESQLFFKCQPDGLAGYRFFLNRFFERKSVVEELRSPFLSRKGIPKVEYLVAEFKAESEQTLRLDINTSSIEFWIQTFVERYVEVTNGITFQVERNAYLQQLANNFSDIDFAGFSPMSRENPKPVKFKEIFIIPDIEEQFIVESKAGSKSKRSNKETEYSKRIVTALRLLKSNENSQLLIQGDAGSGKTALVSYFLLKLCGQIEDNSIENWANGCSDIEVFDDITDRLPIIIRIRDFVENFKNESVLDFVRHYARNRLSCESLPEDFFEYWLKSGKAFIFIDGIDEAPWSERSEVITKVKTFLKRYDNKNRAIITSRTALSPEAYFDKEEFSFCEIQPFDARKVNQFVDKWYDIHVPDKNELERRKTGIKNELKTNERIALLAKTPMLLTLILLVHRDKKQMPKERCDLYNHAVNTLLEAWDASKKIDRLSPVLKHIESDDLRFLMSQLAYSIQVVEAENHQIRTPAINEGNAISILSESIRDRRSISYDKAKREAERFLTKIVCVQTGLLNYQGGDSYNFAHKTFQEYLCAEHLYHRIMSVDDVESVLNEIQPHMHKEEWQEVIRILAAQLGGARAAQLICKIFYLNSSYEKFLHRDLILSGLCLVENPKNLLTQKSGKKVILEIIKNLVQIDVEDVSIYYGNATKGRVVEILLGLNGTSVQVEALKIIESYAEKFLSRKLSMYRYVLGGDEGFVREIASRIRAKDKAKQEIEVSKYLSRYSNILELLIDEFKLSFRGEEDTALILRKLGCNEESVNKALRARDDYEHYRIEEEQAYEAYKEAQYEESIAEYEEEAEPLYVEVNLLLEKLKNQPDSSLNTLIEEWLPLDEFGICDYVSKAIGNASIDMPCIEGVLLRKFKEKSDEMVSHEWWKEWELAQIVETIGRLNYISEETSRFLITLLSGRGGINVKSSILKVIGNFMETSKNSDQFVNLHDVLLNRLIKLLTINMSLQQANKIAGTDYKYEHLASDIFKLLIKIGKNSSNTATALSRWIEDNKDTGNRRQISLAIDALGEISS